MLNSVRDNAWNQIRQGWITVLLVGVVVVSWLQVIASADWLRDTNVLVSAAICGVLYGLLLASSRFRGRTALIIDLVTALGFALLVAGRVLPEMKLLTAQPFEKTIWLMNARTFTLLEALRDDAQWLVTNYFPSTRLFLFLNVFAVWTAAAWLMWCVARRKRALAGVLPIALLIAYYTGLGKDGPSVPLWFIGGSVLLMARTAFTYTTHDWDRRRVGYPDLIGEDWAAAAATLSVAVILLAGISTPEWRSSMQRFMESLRPPPPADKTAAPVVVQVKPTGDYAASFVPSMGYVGDPFPESAETIFYVTTSDSPSGMESNGVAKPPTQQHYWRGAIYDRYTGTGWEQLNVSVAVSSPESIDLVAPGRYALTQQYQIVSLQDNRLFAAGQPVASKDAALQAAPEDATAILPRGRIPRYEITSWAPKVSAEELEAATPMYPPEIATRYLQLPDSVPQRVKDLAARLVHGAASPYDKAIRVQEYLRATYPYKLNVPAPPSNRDVVDYFLFDAPGGFCSYYASAMTVLLRSQGVPARVVVGFAAGDYDGLLRRYVVPANAAHSWVEVYFPNYGWIEFEPTSSRSTFEYTGKETPLPDRQPETSTARSDDAAQTVIAIGAFAVLLIGSVGFAAFYLWRRQRLLQLAPEVQARKLYWQTRRSLAQLGFEASGSATPVEFLDACADRLIDHPSLQESVRRVTELYIRAVFMPAPPDRSDVDSVRRSWRSTWRERVRLRWRRMKSRLEH
ncbi:MAG TPA: transglutaminaseTgpA domain-containing protein [Anaerolineae bacterium]|nr:transglutaminaseTgpA domain-containing protein [Anaerolineae bacterium]